jgi:hypothetical protein
MKAEKLLKEIFDMVWTPDEPNDKKFAHADDLQEELYFMKKDWLKKNKTCDKEQKFKSLYNFSYIEKCDNCGEKIQIKTQPDHFNQYTTTVYIQCSCGHYVEFTLPIN